MNGRQMKKTSKKISVQSRALPTGADNPRKVAALQNSAATPLFRQRRRRVIRKAHFRLSRTSQGMLLNVPAFRDYVTQRIRSVQVRAALNMMASGKHSMRTAAAVLDLSPPLLCGLLQKFRDRGEAGLHPVPRNRRKGTAAGDPCRIEFHLLA